MMQAIAVKIVTNPVVLETLEALAVSGILMGAKSLMDNYIDNVARSRAETIVRQMNNRR